MREFDVCRLMRLINRYPRHKWRFKVWQWLYIRQHVGRCMACTELVNRTAGPESIGPDKSPN